jgi:hypothetical protein
MAASPDKDNKRIRVGAHEKQATISSPFWSGIFMPVAHHLFLCVLKEPQRERCVKKRIGMDCLLMRSLLEAIGIRGIA